MTVAKMFNTPVILVASIDKGGVFVSLVGTMELLKPEARRPAFIVYFTQSGLETVGLTVKIYLS